MSPPPPLPHLYGHIPVDCVQVLVGLVLGQDGREVLPAGQHHRGEGLHQLLHVLAVVHVVVVGAVEGVGGVGVCTVWNTNTVTGASGCYTQSQSVLYEPHRLAILSTTKTHTDSPAYYYAPMHGLQAHAHTHKCTHSHIHTSLN